MSKRHAGLNRRRWAATRRAVFDRDGWRCRQCGRAARLECDHVDRNPDIDPYDMANLQAVCRECHIEKTRREMGGEVLDPQRAAWRDLVREI